MSKPIQITSGSKFRDTLRDYHIVFAMFYTCSNLSTPAIQQLFESLCEEHSTSSVVFIKVKKDDFPGLCVEYEIPRSTSLTFATFKNERNLGMTHGTKSADLERMVHSHIGSIAPSLEGREGPACDCCESRARARCADSGFECLVLRSRRAARPHRIPFVVDLPTRYHMDRKATIPADLTYVDRRGPLTVERSAHLEYLGRDGRYHRADGVHLERTARGAEATYLDRSDTIALERTIGR